MSYDITLNDDNGNVLRLPEHMRFEEGGTFAMGGTIECELNVTYNYAVLYDFRSLDGKRADSTVKDMFGKVLELGLIRDVDYWQPTPGNVGCALWRLLTFAVYHPDGIWKVN